MGAIEDSRTVLQDFLAPALRAIAARLDALEKNVGENERRAELGHSETMSAIRQVLDLNSIQQRLTKFESREVAHQ